MCTAICEWKGRHLFGRTLDYERSWGERVVVTPRGWSLRLCGESALRVSQAMMGMAAVHEGQPLYYDAINQAGLGMAALNFPRLAHYETGRGEGQRVPSFALIPWVLGQCETLEAACRLLRTCCVTADSASAELPATPLHWLLCDGRRAVAIEPLGTGLSIVEDGFGVLTNAPEFSYHATHLSDFMGLGATGRDNRLCPEQPLEPYSRGLGAMGLPGDYSSASRFVRAVFAKNAMPPPDPEDEVAALSRFFHLLDAVSVPRGCVRSEQGEAVETIYSCCMDPATMRYYYTTSACRRIQCVEMCDEAANATSLAQYPLVRQEEIARVQASR